jgi:hypothetical protein
MPISLDASGDSALPPGLIAEFDSIYRTRTGENRWWNDLFHTVKTDGAYEVVHGFNSVPIPQVWLRGDARTHSGFADFAKTVYVYDYQLTLDWHENDEADDRTKGSLIARVREGAERFSQWDELALYDLVQGSNTYLHPSTDFNCHDSNPLYSSSHTTRTGGNIVSGGGVTAAHQIRTDWFKVLTAFREMTDTEGEPYWRDSLDRAKLVVVAPPQLEEVMTEAFEADLILASGATAPSTNVLPKRARTSLVIWERLPTTSDSWYVFLTGIGESRPFIKLDRQQVMTREWNADNSDRARDTKMKGIGFDIRVGYGALNYHTTVQVDNS